MPFHRHVLLENCQLPAQASGLRPPPPVSSVFYILLPGTAGNWAGEGFAARLASPRENWLWMNLVYHLVQTDHFRDEQNKAYSG